MHRVTHRDSLRVCLTCAISSAPLSVPHAQARQDWSITHLTRASNLSVAATPDTLWSSCGDHTSTRLKKIIGPIFDIADPGFLDGLVYMMSTRTGYNPPTTAGETILFCSIRHSPPDRTVQNLMKVFASLGEHQECRETNAMTEPKICGSFHSLSQ